MVTQQQLLAVLFAGIVVLSGCTGWGTDGSAEEGDGEPNQTDDLEDANANADANTTANASDETDANATTNTHTNTNTSADTETNTTTTTNASDNTTDATEAVDKSDDADAAAQSSGDDEDESTTEPGQTGDSDSQTQDHTQDDETDESESDSSDDVSDESDTADKDGEDTDSTDESDASDRESDTSDDSDSADDGDSSADSTDGATDGDGDSSDGNETDGDGTTDGDSDGDRDNNKDTNDKPEKDTLTVTVTDPDGEPIEGATVDLATYDEGEHVVSGTTDKHGEVTFEVTPGDYEVLVDTEPLEYTDSGTHPVEVDGDTEYTVQLASPPSDGTDTDSDSTDSDDGDSDSDSSDDDSDSGNGTTDDDSDSDRDNKNDTNDEPTTHTLTVTVTNPDGEPIEGATVDLATYDEGEQVTSGTTDANGEVTFEVTPRDYEVLVDTEPLEYTDSGTHPVEVDGDTEYTVQLTSPPDDGDDTEEDTATGIVRVVDQNGEPVEDEQVLLRPPGTVDDDAREERFTDENGEVVIELLAGESDDVVPYDVEVRGEEKRLPIQSDEHVGVQEVEFEVSENEMHEFERTVRVVDQNGDPVEGESVEALPLGGEEWTDVGTTDENGEVILTGQSSDPTDAQLYDVRVGEQVVYGVAVDNTDRDAEVIEIGEEEPVTVGDLTISVVDAETEDPIADATVTATHRDSDERYEIPTNSDGEAVFKDIPHGEYDVTVEADGWTTTEQTVAFDGDTDEETDLRQTIELSPDQSGTETEESVTVVVEDQNGEPVEGEPVTITYEDGSEFEHETDANGEHVVSPDITDGSDDVVPITVEVRDQSETVLLHDGEKKTATFTVETEGGNGNVTEPVNETTGNETVAPGPSPNESTANATG